MIRTRTTFHTLLQAALVVLNLFLWPYGLAYRHKLELTPLFGFPIGLMVGLGLAGLYGMAFLEGGEAVARRLKANRARAALVAVWGIAVVAACGLALSHHVIRKPIPKSMRDLSGDEFMAGGNYDYAERTYLQEITKADPADPKPWYGLAQAQMKLRKLAKAEASARRSLEIAPQRPEGRFHLARVLMASGRPEDAIKEARTGLERAPDRHDLKDIEGLALTELGDLIGAEKIYAELCKADPKNPVWGVRRASALHELGRNAQSREVLDAAIMRMRSAVDEDPNDFRKIETMMGLSRRLHRSLTAAGHPTKVDAWRPRPPAGREAGPAARGEGPESRGDAPGPDERRRARSEPSRPREKRPRRDE